MSSDGRPKKSVEHESGSAENHFVNIPEKSFFYFLVF